MSDTPRATLYVAKRWPPEYIVFRMLCDSPPEAVDELREEIIASVREALDVLGVGVVEGDDRV